MDALFLADSFVKSFGKNRVLKSASAWARAGEVTVLLGRNGCGKSTLLRAALGLCTSEVGLVRYDGKVVLRPRLWRLAARGLFYLPDRHLLSRRIRFGKQLDLIKARFGVGDFAEILTSLEVEELVGVTPREMSGGELRRAELALALARRPRCLIADEPLTEIEPKDRGLIAGMLRAQAAGGGAVLLTGHEVQELLDIADEVIWMSGGTTHGLGRPLQAKAHHQFRNEYLGSRGIA